MYCLAALAFLAIADAVSADDRSAPKKDVQPADNFSPLHELLGIDPKTGEFKPRGAQPHRQGGLSPGSSGVPSGPVGDATRKIGSLANRAPGDQPGIEGDLADLNAIL